MFGERASCILLIGIGIWELLYGPGSYRGVEIHQVTPWVLIAIGGGGIIYSCYNAKRLGKKSISDEGLAKAEAELDRLYLREHGKLPEKPRPEKVEGE